MTHTNQYTPDMPRPYCPHCGTPVECTTTTPEVPWVGTCSEGHTEQYQLVDEDDEEGDPDEAKSAALKCYIEVVEYDTDEVEHRMGPMSAEKAERVEDGLLRKLDIDRYYTRTVSRQT